MLLDWALLIAAAFAAGVLNAIAGGGSFLTFPALVFVGMPPIVANATSAVVVAPGYLGSVVGFRNELASMARTRLMQESMVCAAGGIAGALLLMVTPAHVFSAVVPWLLLFATALFALAPMLRSRGATTISIPLFGRLGLLAVVATYGGYFNGGLGILLMALYGLIGPAEINPANALKNLGSLVLSLFAVATFALAGAVSWPHAVIMMLAATAGGYSGAGLARRLPASWIRTIVVGTGLVMTVLFFAKG